MKECETLLLKKFTHEDIRKKQVSTKRNLSLPLLSMMRTFLRAGAEA